MDVLVVLGPLTAAPGRADLAALGCGIACASRGGGACEALVLGPQAAAASSAIAELGSRRIHVLEHPDLAHPVAEPVAAAVVRFLEGRGFRLVLAPSSSLSREWMPRVAALTERPMASDVTGVEAVEPEKAVFTRAAYAGNLLQTLELSGPAALATCRPSSFAPPEPTAARAEVSRFELDGTLAHPRKRFVGEERGAGDRPDLAEADIIISVGRGTRGPDQGIKLAAELADLLGAALGATRAVVDAGWLPNELQVGQTGRVVAPNLYIAVGLSGSIQHLAGMRGSRTIVAINKDPEAPIFAVADYGLVADLFDALPRMVAEIRRSKSP